MLLAAAAAPGAPQAGAPAPPVAGFAPARILPTAAGDSARRAGKRDFDAEGTIPCAQIEGQALTECTAHVARGSGGEATVVVTFPNGFARTLHFMDGTFTSANPTMSGVGTDTDWRREGGVHFIRVDDQRYELSDALVFGD